MAHARSTVKIHLDCLDTFSFIAVPGKNESTEAVELGHSTPADVCGKGEDGCGD